MPEAKSRLSFGKHERLSSEKVITQLFASPSRATLIYPYRAGVLYTKLPTAAPAQVVIAVSASKFKRAHDRNRIKRITREIYRHHKQHIYDKLNAEGKQCAILITYVAREIKTYKEMELALCALLNKLLKIDGPPAK